MQGKLNRGIIDCPAFLFAPTIKCRIVELSGGVRRDMNFPLAIPHPPQPLARVFPCFSRFFPRFPSYRCSVFELRDVAFIFSERIASEIRGDTGKIVDKLLTRYRTRAGFDGRSKIIGKQARDRLSRGKIVENGFFRAAERTLLFYTTQWKIFTRFVLVNPAFVVIRGARACFLRHATAILGCPKSISKI